MDDVSISGLDELQKQLEEFPTKIEKNIMRGAIRAGLKPIMEQAKELCPPDKSGALRKSIRIKFRNRSQQYGWIRGVITAGNFDAWYAHIIEFGSGSFYEGTGTKSKRAPYEIKPRGAKSLFFAGLMREQIIHPGVHPVGFMRKAVDQKTAEGLDAFKEYVASRIQKEFDKAL